MEGIWDEIFADASTGMVMSPIPARWYAGEAWGSGDGSSVKSIPFCGVTPGLAGYVPPSPTANAA